MDDGAKSALTNERRRNSLLNKDMLNDFEKERKVVKILLLGTGNSGKSTILKQFKLIHTEQGLGDTNIHRDIISSNITRAIVLLVQGSVDLPEVTEKLGEENSSAATELRAQYKLSVWDDITLEGGQSIQVGALCKRLWEDPVIQMTMQHESKMPTLEVPVGYFMKNIDRITMGDYVPTNDDILQARARTSGVVAIEFTLDGIKCRMLDVGGQRNERKKWISHFDGVTVIMFLVSLSEYDKVLLEDSTTNRMHDAIEVFKYIVECPYFEETNVILFLNKKDLFAEKIKTVDLNVCFPGYTGPPEYEPAVQYVESQFVNTFRKIKETQNVDTVTADIYSFQTMATNTTNVRTVFEMCKHIIFKTNLANTGML